MDFFAEIDVRSNFPELQSGKFEVTSPKTPAYNCIAWAAGEFHRWWWPDNQNYWPPSVPRARTVEAFVLAFKLLGYEECQDSNLEEGFEKIAIFVGPTKTPTHASRQLQDGQWTSKLGQSYDISHILDQVGGNFGRGYGVATIFMKRRRKQ